MGKRDDGERVVEEEVVVEESQIDSKRSPRTIDEDQSEGKD